MTDTVPYYEDFTEIKKKIWSMLDNAVKDRSSPFRIPVFFHLYRKITLLHFYLLLIFQSYLTLYRYDIAQDYLIDQIFLEQQFFHQNLIDHHK